MKIYLNSTFSLVFTALFATMLGCKKQEMRTSLSESRGTVSTLHSTTESELLLTIIDEKDDQDKASIFLIKKNAANNIIIYNPRPGYGLSWHRNDQYRIIDNNEKEFNFTSKTVFGTKTETGLSGEIRILREGKQIFSNQPSQIFTIKDEGSMFWLSGEGAVLDIKLNKDNNMIIENRNPGSRLGKPLASSHLSYSIYDEEGRSFDFTSETTFPAKTVTKLSGGKIKIARHQRIIFDNQPELKALFTIKEEESSYEGRYQRTVSRAILDIKINSNGNIIIDNKNPNTPLSLNAPKAYYLIQDEYKKVYFIFNNMFPGRIPTGLRGKIQVIKDGNVLFSQF